MTGKQFRKERRSEHEGRQDDNTDHDRSEVDTEGEQPTAKARATADRIISDSYWPVVILLLSRACAAYRRAGHATAGEQPGQGSRLEGEQVNRSRHRWRRGGDRT